MRFADFASAHGLLIHDLYASERIQRCPTDAKPHSKNGAYLWDGERGWVYDWQVHSEVQWYENPDAKPWTEAEREAWRNRHRAQQDQHERHQLQVGLDTEVTLLAAEKAQHNYLFIKGFPDEEGFVLGNELLVPMRNFFTGKLAGVQRIWWNMEERRYEKKMTFGMKAKGAVYWLGDKKAGEVILCEGYATGLSIYAAINTVGLRMAVLVCFSANNMVLIAKHIKSKAYIFADNDASGAGEAAAVTSGLPYMMSTTPGFDANDHHLKYGLMKLLGVIMVARLST